MNTLFVIYVVGYLITVVLADEDNRRRVPYERVPFAGILLVAAFWPLIWVANIVSWLTGDDG